MTIQYEVSEQDYINFNIYYYYNCKNIKSIRIALKILPIVCSFMILVLLKREFLFSTVGISTFSIISFILIWLEPKMTQYFFRKSIPTFIKSGKANGFLGKQTIKLTEEYIEDGNENKTSKIKYSTIERIDFGHGLFYIYIGAIEAIIIPAKAFANEEQKNSFFDIISEKTQLDLSNIKQIKLNS